MIQNITHQKKTQFANNFCRIPPCSHFPLSSSALRGASGSVKNPASRAWSRDPYAADELEAIEADMILKIHKIRNPVQIQ